MAEQMSDVEQRAAECIRAECDSVPGTWRFDRNLLAIALSRAGLLATPLMLEAVRADG